QPERGIAAPVIARALRPQRRDGIDGLEHMWPELVQEREVAGQTVELHDPPDELSVTIMLDGLVDPVPVDGTGNASISKLIRHVPAQEAAQLVRESHLDQRRTGECPVADPRAPIAARPRLYARSFSVDENPGDRRSQAVGDRRGAFRQLDRDPAQA